MKKTLIFNFIILLIPIFSKAQFNKGDFSVGTSVLYNSTTKNADARKETTFQISPEINYTLSKAVTLGLGYDYKISTTKSTTEYDYSFQSISSNNTQKSELGFIQIKYQINIAKKLALQWNLKWGIGNENNNSSAVASRVQVSFDKTNGMPDAFIFYIPKDSLSKYPVIYSEERLGNRNQPQSQISLGPILFYQASKHVALHLLMGGLVFEKTRNEYFKYQNTLINFSPKYWKIGIFYVLGKKESIKKTTESEKK
ncbi:MAG: hypothetical protein KA327_11160 [Pseudarcicella sp.]|nr:hypothetical protein [Pseudarcicella sp.]